MTKETRLENQTKVKEIGERQKTTIRNIRQDHLKLIKKAFKDDPGLGKDAVAKAEKVVEKEMKSTLNEIEKLTEKIMKEVMTV